MSETLSPKPKQSSTERDLAEVARILEFGIVLLLAYLIANYVRELLKTTTVDSTVQVLLQIVTFFIVPLIYYKLIRIHWEVETDIK